MIHRLETVASGQNSKACAAPGIATIYFFGTTGMDDIRAFEKAIHIASRDGEKIAVGLSVHPESRPPEKEIRAGLTNCMSNLKGKTLCFAGVIGGSGLGAASRRTLMRAVLSMSRIDDPCEVFGDVRDAAKFLSQGLANARDLRYDLESIYLALAPPDELGFGARL